MKGVRQMNIRFTIFTIIVAAIGATIWAMNEVLIQDVLFNLIVK
jgi:hypothetical protein